VLQPAASATATTTILFTGDILLDRAIRIFADAYGPDYVFSCIADELKKPAMVVSNLEGPITASSSVSVHVLPDEPDNTRFTFPLYAPELLKRYNIGIVNLGNNHLMDFGALGVASTQQALDAGKVEHFGDPDERGVPRPLLTRINGQYIAFVNYNEWFGTRDDAIDQIKKYAGLVPVVVYTHWGDEYQSPPERVKKLAHQFVDAGASIVIGSHPHVVQTHETYKGVPIYYSLGNFIFDQYWDPSVETGLALEVDFGDNKVLGVREHAVDIGKNGQTCFAKE
jgi:poly-gamma-glutamate synthesis protein (capsule biosynthesis protein)